MSEDQAKYTVKFGEGERMKELVIRHGEAQVIELPEKIAVIGNIDAPGRFVKTRDPLHDEKKCHVYVSRANGTITFIEDETNPQRKVITGKLVQSPELEAFRINTGNKSGLKDLTNFLRMRRRYFHDKEEHTTLIDRLSNFVAKVNTKIQTKDDRKGHTLIMIEKKVSHEIPPAFKLDMRLFVGQPKVTFAVDILAEISDGSVSLWLESVELAEILLETGEAIINEELKSFAQYLVIEA